jgi:hypothetical protein
MQRYPLLALFIAAGTVLLGGMKVILEIIDAILAVYLSIVRAVVLRTLVLLDETPTATAFCHLYHLALVTLHVTIKY